MGQKQSKSSIYSRYLSSLPEYYERIGSSEVYAMRNQNHTGVPSTNPQIPNPENSPSKQKQQQLEILDSKTVHSQKSTFMQGLPSYVRHFVVILNEFQTRDYLNHLVYRNQPEFKEFIVQVPFGEIEKHQKYTKIHLYAQEVALTLNHVFNLPFQDMCMVLYTSLIAYKYLYSYFGLFKIQDNMIGFTRQGKTKVWINHKLTKDKPLPIVTDINLKRNKQEQNYMVDDLMQIFWNKVDKQTVPNNFTLINKFSSMRTSRHNPSRLTVSRTQNEAQMSKLLLKSLQNNLVEDFSEGSFDKCLEYIQGYFNIKKPQFLKSDLLKRPQDSQLSSKYSSRYNPNAQPYRNFIPSIQYLVRNRKQLSRDSADLRSSSVHFSIDFKQVSGGASSSNKPEMRRTDSNEFIYDSKLQNKGYVFDQQSKRQPFQMGRQSVCRQVNLQNIGPNLFNLPMTKQPSTLSPTIAKSETKTMSNQALGEMNYNPIIMKKEQPQVGNLQSTKKSQKISIRMMLQPDEVNSSLTPYDTVTTSQQQTATAYVQNSRPFSEIRSPTSYSMNNGTRSNKNIRFSLVNPSQFNQMEQTANQYKEGQTFQSRYSAKHNTIINRVINI